MSPQAIVISWHEATFPPAALPFYIKRRFFPPHYCHFTVWGNNSPCIVAILWSKATIIPQVTPFNSMWQQYPPSCLNFTVQGCNIAFFMVQGHISLCNFSISLDLAMIMPQELPFYHARLQFPANWRHLEAWGKNSPTALPFYSARQKLPQHNCQVTVWGNVLPPPLIKSVL